MFFDPYQVLGISRDASDEEIKKSIQEIEPEVSPGCQCKQSQCGSGRRKI